VTFLIVPKKRANVFISIQRYQNPKNLNLIADIGLIVLTHNALTYTLWDMLDQRSKILHRVAMETVALDQAAISFILVIQLLGMRNW
jgi:hypothetical protein